MRTAAVRFTGHTTVPDTIASYRAIGIVVPVVPVYATAPTIRKAVPVPDHRGERPHHPIVTLIIWCMVVALFAAAALLLRGVMHEPLGARSWPAGVVNTVPHPTPQPAPVG